jgi:hypothetical protein
MALAQTESRTQSGPHPAYAIQKDLPGTTRKIAEHWQKAEDIHTTAASLIA